MQTDVQPSGGDTPARKKMSIWLRAFRWTVILITFMIALMLTLLLPPVQTQVVSTLSKFLSERTGSRVEVERVSILLPGRIHLRGVFVEDSRRDTLLWVGRAGLNVAILPLLGKKLHIQDLVLADLRVKLVKCAEDSAFNFQMFLDAVGGPGNKDKEPDKGLNWRIEAGLLALHRPYLSYLDEIDSLSYDLRANLISAENGRFFLPEEPHEDPGSAGHSIPGIALAKFRLLALEIMDQRHGEEYMRFTAVENLITGLGVDPVDKTVNLKSWSIKRPEFRMEALNEIQRPKGELAEISQQYPGFPLAALPWKIRMAQARLANGAIQIPAPWKPATDTLRTTWSISNLNIALDSVRIEEDYLSMVLRQAQFSDGDLFRLDTLQGVFTAHEQEITADRVRIITRDSRIDLSAIARVESFSDFFSKPEEVRLNSSMRSPAIGLQDIRYFGIHTDSMLYGLVGSAFAVDLKFHGRVSDFEFQTYLWTAGQFSLTLGGQVQGMPVLEQSSFELHLDHLGLNEAAIRNMLGQPKIPDTDSLTFKAHLKGAYRNADLAFGFKTAVDSITGTLRWTGDAREDSIALYAMAHLGGLSRWTGTTQLGNLRGNLLAHLSLDELKWSRLEAGFKIDSLQFDNNTFCQIHAQLSGQPDRFELGLQVNDPKVPASLHATYHHQPDGGLKLAADAAVAVANLADFDLTVHELYAETKIRFELEFTDMSKFSAGLELSELSLIGPGRELSLTPFRFSAEADDLLYQFHLESDYLNGSLQSDFPPDELTGRLKYLVDYHLQKANPDTSMAGGGCMFEFRLIDPTPFNDFFIAERISIAPFEASLYYSGDEYTLNTEISLPQMRYNSFQVNGLDILVGSNNRRFRSSLQIDSLQIDTLTMPGTRLLAEVSSGKLGSDLSVIDRTGRQMYRASVEAESRDNLLAFRLLPGLLLNYKEWNLPADNQIVIGEHFLRAHNMTLGRDSAHITVRTPEDSKLQIKLEHLDLSYLTALLGGRVNERHISGMLNAEIEIRDPSHKFSLGWDVGLHKVQLLQFDMGDVRVGGVFYPDSLLNLRGMLSDSAGVLHFANSTALDRSPVHIKGALTGVLGDLQRFQSLAGDDLVEFSGSLLPDLNWSGTPENPGLRGTLGFNNTGFRFVPLNSTARIDDEKISFETGTIRMHGFDVQDTYGNKLTFDGSIDIRELSNPVFNLKISSGAFLAIDQQRERDQEVYGRLLLQGDLELKGTSRAPELSGRIGIDESTVLNYKLPGSELSMVSDEGIVIYSNEPLVMGVTDTAGRTQTKLDSLTEGLGGMQLSIRLEIPEMARFNIITNPNSGDNVEFRLRGILNYRYNPVSRNRLNGQIEFTEGQYNLSFYGLVRKQFTFMPGSRVIWSGIIDDGQIDFTAVHEVMTSSVGLVSGIISEAERGRYDRRLPYEVQLIVGGSLADPTFTFGIDLPERHKRENNVIASKLDALNQPENEAERNRQAFALLVGSTFIPEATGVTETSFATTAARNSLNAILTAQLNSLTSQIIRGVDVNLGFSTVEDYSAGAQGTSRNQLDVQVNKNIFNERVRLEMESHINLDGNTPQGTTPANQAEFAVYYKINPEGSMQIKAFSENAFDMLDGDIQNSGISILFLREFDPKRYRQQQSPPPVD